MTQTKEAIELLRSKLSSEINADMSDADVARFLTARKGNYDHAVEMITKWFTWRHQELPGPLTGATPRNILEMTADQNISNSPHKHLLPHLLKGFDKEGSPIIWEKTGTISRNYAEAKKIWSMDEFLYMHLRVQELSEVRLKYASKKFEKEISQTIVIFDIAGMQSTPDFDTISFTRKMLSLDQAFYPERLNKLFLINCPWYFPPIYALVKAFIDPVTAKKIHILRDDFLPHLQAFISDENIPSEYGGTMEPSDWGGPWDDSCGCSPEQILEIRGVGSNQEQQHLKIKDSN